MALLSEYATRRDKIDILLEKAGWNIRDQTRVLCEVDTKQSNFQRLDYKTVKDTLNDPQIDDRAYADYLLLDSSASPIAIIEAKRTSRDPITGQRQAEGYANDIKKQIGKDVFIFLTNGYEIWFWNKPFENPRMVKGFHTRENLERIRFQNEYESSYSDFPIKPQIVDRDYQIESVKRVLEGIESGKRKFLIVQATGTGKTRVAMALIDVLLRSKRAQKILFLADRQALRDQAYNDGYKIFFPNELKTVIFTSRLDKAPRLFASTIQTFMECYQDFSIGDFDVIIADECHRSIYNKWKDVFTYFDAIEIGLTATPAELLERDTFRFFDCYQGVPTALYSYEDAVNNKWLVPFKVRKTKTHFQIAGIKSQDVPSQLIRDLSEKGVEPEDIDFEGSDIEKKVVVIGTNEAVVKEFMENCYTDSTGTLPSKTIFFAITKEHAKRIWEAFERLYPNYKGRLARIITSDDSRAKVLLAEFRTESFPRIAISVDMLDTGVDIPEVCNLVFAKPVLSKIRFWQMIGRGSRSQAACKHMDWLPNGKKEDFLIFDCWGVFNWFDVHPEGKESSVSEAVPSRIFLLRLEQLRVFQKMNDDIHADLVKQKIISDIDSLPLDSVSVRERLREVELAKTPNFWTRVGIEPLEYLKKYICPMMKFMQDVEPNQAYFTQRCELLGLAVLNKNGNEVERLKQEICEDLNHLRLTIKEVEEKEQLIDRVCSPLFWVNPSFDDSQLIMNELGPLMKYKSSEPRMKVVLDIDDMIQQREILEYGPSEAPQSEYVVEYRRKVENWIRKLAEDHPTIQKIKKDEVLTELDLERLEKTLNTPGLFITEESLQKAFKQSKGTLVEFIKKILGLYDFPDPEKRIDDAFKTFMVEKNYLNSDQVNFLRTIETVFKKKHHIEFSDLYEPPFTNFGSKAPVPLLEKEDLEKVMQLCKGLEIEVFTKKNA